MFTTGDRCRSMHWTAMSDRHVEGGRRIGPTSLRRCVKECEADRWCYALDFSWESYFLSSSRIFYLHGPMSWGNPIQSRKACTHYRLNYCPGKPDTLSIYIE